MGPSGPIQRIAIPAPRGPWELEAAAEGARLAELARERLEAAGEAAGGASPARWGRAWYALALELSAEDATRDLLAGLHSSAARWRSGTGWLGLLNRDPLEYATRRTFLRAMQRGWNLDPAWRPDRQIGPAWSPVTAELREQLGADQALEAEPDQALEAEPDQALEAPAPAPAEPDQALEGAVDQAEQLAATGDRLWRCYALGHAGRWGELLAELPPLEALEALAAARHPDCEALGALLELEGLVDQARELITSANRRVCAA